MIYIYRARGNFVNSPSGEKYQYKKRVPAFSYSPKGDEWLRASCPMGNKTGLSVFSIDMNALRAIL
jgi:hypothetical protein